MKSHDSGVEAGEFKRLVAHAQTLVEDAAMNAVKAATRSRNIQDKKWHAGQRTYKISPTQALEIRELNRVDKLSHRTLAKMYGVSRSAIYQILHGITHADV